MLGDPATLDVSLLPEALRPQAPDLVEQLNAGWSGHGFNSHAAERMLDFAWGHGSVAESVPTPEPTRRAYAGHVTVSGGAAGKGDFDGSDAWYTDRDRVHLWAEPDPPGLIFDHWRSENPSLADPRSRHTVFQVLSPSTTISANFAPAPDWRPAQRLVDGRDVYFHAPPDPVGLVFYFHGAGGSSRGWVTPTNAENWQALRDAVARGYAVAVPIATCVCVRFRRPSLSARSSRPARPKSVTFAMPPAWSSKRMFSGFRSRWMTPRLCA